MLLVVVLVLCLCVKVVIWVGNWCWDLMFESGEMLVLFEDGVLCVLVKFVEFDGL